MYAKDLVYTFIKFFQKIQASKLLLVLIWIHNLNFFFSTNNN